MMSRSKWKGPYVNPKDLEKLKDNLKKKCVFVVSKSSEITPKFLGLTLKVHDGRSFAELTVLETMLGHKFGEFVFTRARYVFKNKKKKRE